MKLFDNIKLGFKALYLSVYEGYTYHAASLTYSFLMILGSLALFSNFIASFLPFFDFDRLASYFSRFFPQQAEGMMVKIFEIYRHRVSGSIISILIAYFFSVGFSKSLHRAFLYILSQTYKEKEYIFWIKTPVFIIAYTLFLPFISLFMSVIKYHLVGFFSYMFYVVNLLSIWLVVFLVYYLFLPIGYSMLYLFQGALFVSISSFFLNKIFTLFVVKIILLNPLYGLMGSVLLFLIWSNLSFTVLLAGAKYIQLIEKEKKNNCVY
ncbi:MAG: YhjD/YihY/BrkB family envelope integrity protein [Aquificaceae bacterium]